MRRPFTRGPDGDRAAEEKETLLGRAPAPSLIVCNEEEKEKTYKSLSSLGHAMG